ncbi:creatinine amidohydrolase [Haladaptatus litoreus]|uniref:Creatinine amidohydrolase n=1 Tax=Haladaptatus litoreus TaxID=553468 RepID=A0A1N6W1Q8_9EURY|nr:creatininase family protein [Haladaptatus litoreus]SIQ83988.1 creatinine amidohydrolase [Haladaptatus litoreus]
MTVRLDYDSFDLGGMTWEDAEEAIPNADFLVLPTGSVEQHSIHLPVTVDTLRAEALSRELVESASEHDLSMVRLPTLPYGYSEHHMNYAGTITLSAETYMHVVEEIAQSMAKHGAKRLVLLNCHGGNRSPLKLAGDRIQRDHGVKVFFVHWTDFARDKLKERFGEEWGHAGDHETSVIELFYPDLVKSDKKESQTRKARFEARQYTYFDDITEQGGLGDPTESDAEFLEEIVAETTEKILSALSEDMEQEG